MRYLIQMGLTRYFFNHKMIYKKTIFKRIEDSLVLVYRIFSILLNIYLLYISESLVCRSVCLVRQYRCLRGGMEFRHLHVRCRRWLLLQLPV